MVEDVQAFMTKYDLPQLSNPGLIDDRLMAYRIDFLLEEWDELQSAYTDDDLEECFDALLDIIYVAIGTGLMMGLPMEEGWLRVHHANMQKVRVKDKSESKRNSPYDLKKPEGWRPPFFKDLL